MTFWSSQSLRVKLQDLVTPFYSARVQQASYTLTIGNEIYVTKDYHDTDSQHTKRILNNNEAFTIPPGQFALLLTEEIVEVPKNAIAFISMKAGIKHKGLINISGFHVDPGFKGKLLFSVYNAGTTKINLKRGQECFLIWYSNLDEEDDNPRTVEGFSEIPIAVLDQISNNEIYSLQALTKEFHILDSKITEKIHTIEKLETNVTNTKDNADKYISILKLIGRLVILIIVMSMIYLSSTIISIGKFAIEQREIVSNLSNYKTVLDELVEKRKNAKNN